MGVTVFPRTFYPVIEDRFRDSSGVFVFTWLIDFRLACNIDDSGSGMLDLQLKIFDVEFDAETGTLFDSAIRVYNSFVSSKVGY